MSAASRQPSTFPADALLAADGVSLEYRTHSRVVRATQWVSFEVDLTGHFVLLDPSGCGKSALFRAVAGFIPPNKNEIRLQRQTIRAPGPDHIIVFQEFDQLPPWKTVQQSMLFPLRMLGQVARDGAERRADKYLEKVGLAGFAEAYPYVLSGGMKARVTITQALAMQSKILLMGEPFVTLGALTRRKIQEELPRLWEEVRSTLLFVTHSIEEALVAGNRILLLSSHPGWVRTEVHSHPLGLHNSGGEPLQAAMRYIPRLLFDEDGEPMAAETLDFTDIRLIH